MTIEPVTVENAGISTNDAVAIKQTILHAVKEGCAGETATAASLAHDLIAAFKAIDDEVLARAEVVSAATAGNGAYLSPSAGQLTPPPA